MSKFTTIRFEAGVTREGAVRRVFVVMDSTRAGDIVATYDQGYAGVQAITNPHHRRAFHGVTFQTTIAEYNGLVGMSSALAWAAQERRKHNDWKRAYPW